MRLDVCDELIMSEHGKIVTEFLKNATLLMLPMDHAASHDAGKFDEGDVQTDVVAENARTGKVCACPMRDARLQNPAGDR